MNSKKNSKEGYYSSLTGWHRAVPIVLAALAMFIMICLMAEGTGIAGAGISSVLKGLFSFGAYAIPVMIALHAIFYAEDIAKERLLSRVIFSAITVIVVSCIEYTICFWGTEPAFTPIESYTGATNGGFIGSVVAFAIVKILGPVGLIISAIAVLAIYIAFFFMDGNGALGRFLLAVLGTIANGLAKAEKGVKKLIGKAKEAKANKEKREYEKKSAELLDDPFFAVDNGMKELKINELGILESRNSDDLEENPTLQDSVFHKSAINKDESVKADTDRPNEEVYIAKDEPLSQPAKKRAVNLSYGYASGELFESVGKESKKEDIIYESSVFETGEAPKQLVSKANYGIDENADAVFTSAFNPFDFDAAEKIAAKASSKASSVQSAGITQMEKPIGVSELPTAEEVARQKRLEDFERRKQAILARSKAEEIAQKATSDVAVTPVENPEPVPATAQSATEETSDTVQCGNDTTVTEAPDVAVETNHTVDFENFTSQAPRAVEHEFGTYHRESPKTVEINFSNEPKKMNDGPIEGAMFKRTFEKPEYKSVNADEAAVLIAEAVAMKNPAYARSANELHTHTQVVSDPVAIDDNTYVDEEQNDNCSSAAEYVTETVQPTADEEFKPYPTPEQMLSAESATVAEFEPVLKTERTLVSPTADAFTTVLQRRDEKYTVIGEEMNLADDIRVTEDPETDDEVIWSSGEASVSEEVVSFNSDGSVLDFGTDDDYELEEDEDATDDSAEIFGGLDFETEEDFDEEEIPPEEQNEDVLKQQQMFPSIFRDDNIDQADDTEDEPIEEPYIEPYIEDSESFDEVDEDLEDDMPPFENATVAQPVVESTPAPAPAPKKEVVKEEKPKPQKPDYSNYEFPSIELLGLDKEMTDENVQYEIQENADRLIDTLASFNVTASIKGVDRGPRITRYEVVPAKGVKVSSIMNLQDDIALSLAADGIRMEAPIPGKSAVGVEIPNKKSSNVRLRELLETEDFLSMKSKTAICIGKDVAGQPVINDISKMPHLLIAGATGMGKSVCINSLLISILYKARPDEVKLIMIDPKQVEFTMYNGIPHLLIPVVSDAKQAAGALMWAVEEMERRYNLLNPLCVRNVDAYNEKVTADPSLGEPMSKIIIVIDEFADLMLQVKDPVENLVMRIAQKARAAGIHLIVGTQRPSTNVITGTIKANIPSRISCKVASNVDSRTVLDAVGAEKLLNKGDMLFSYAGAIKPLRVQGAFVADNEVEAIMAHIKQFSGGANYDETVMEEIKRAADKCSKKGSNGSDHDDDDGESGGEGYLNDKQFLDAVDVAVNTGKISTSLLQRKLSIGYGKAAKFIDVMCDMGIVGESNGQKPRDVLISSDEWHEKLARTMID